MVPGGAAAGGVLNEVFATPRLGRRFADLERERARFRQRVEGLSPEELARAPAPDAWSVLQVMEHLVVAEEGIVVGLTKPPVPGRRVTARNVATLWMIYVIFALRIRVRVPSPRLVPAGGGSLGELEARWESARAAIRALVAPVPVMERRRPRFRHPIAGWLTLDQGLQFAARHIRHHRRQVDRIRRTFGR